jgi:hypothetical protein
MVQNKRLPVELRGSCPMCNEANPYYLNIRELK